MACYSSVRIRFRGAKNRFQAAAAGVQSLRPHFARGFVLLLLVLFYLFAGAGAKAQDSHDDSSSNVSPNVITLSSPTKSGAPQSPFAGRSPLPWQVSVGYQFNHVNVRGSLIPFNAIGVNASVVRYIVQGFGLEAAAGGGYGIAQQNAKAGTLFVGAGAHLIYMNRTRFEPWGHGLIGGATLLNLGAPYTPPRLEPSRGLPEAALTTASARDSQFAYRRIIWARISGAHSNETSRLSAASCGISSALTVVTKVTSQGYRRPPGPKKTHQICILINGHLKGVDGN